MGVRKKQMAERIKEERKQVAFARLNDFPTSPRKMRLVADLIRGKEIELALGRRDGEVGGMVRSAGW